MYSKEIIQLATQLKESDLNLSQISRQMGIDRATIREWFSENKRYAAKNSNSKNNDFFDRFEENKEVRKAYYYLLGQYLGDGHISRNSRTYRIRISATKKYSDIIEEIKNAIRLVLPSNKIYEIHSKGCVVITSNSNHLPEIFPHCGDGKKHERLIELREWQMKHLDENSKYLARGLFHSDGCFYNKNNRKWYVFSNCSSDIHEIFQHCLKVNNIHYNQTQNKPRINQTISWNTLIYRKAEIDKAYEFLGEKS